MAKDSTKSASNLLLGGAEWHDSIEACVRREIRGFIELMLEAELASALGRARYARGRAPERLLDVSESGPEASAAAGSRPPQRSSRSRADGHVWEDDDIGSTRTTGDL